jgi:hypothetical protein
MSLRSMHVFFIVMSVLLAVFFSGWAGTAYRADHGVVYLAIAVLSLTAAAGLAGYAAAFLRKTRRLL